MNLLQKLFSKPHSSTLTVTSNNGFHLRPVAQFVSKAKTFDCNIEASFKNKTVSAKAVNALLSLNLDKQDSFTLTTKGTLAEEALSSLVELFTALMQNDEEIVNIQNKTHNYENTVIEGSILSTGIAIAPLYIYKEEELYTFNDADFTEAFTHSVNALETLHIKEAKKETHNTQNNASIYLAQKELLLSLDKEGQTLVDFEALIAKESQALKGGKLEAKIADYQDLLKRVKTHLGYSYEVHFPSTPFILVANDLLPSDIQTLEQHPTQGVILKKTSATSHTAILLRASGITSLILNADISKGKETVSKKTVILDTQAGVLVLTPSVDDIEKAKATQKLHASQKEKSYAKRHQKAQTETGKHIAVLANVADVDSAKLAKEEGAEGIGLLRTEFLFTEQKPSLEAQTKAYTEIFKLFNDVTVRTLDVGGDKALPYITLPKESNPFLGIRGIRLLKTHPKIISEQLHAIFIAAKNRPIKVMFPMVSTVEEFNEAKSFAQNIAQKYELDISNIFFGIMVEVPSVLFLIKDFNKVVDFYSIGTNDLSQYLFATERTHPTLTIDELSPVIFTALTSIVKQATKPVSICGELASNKGAIGKLIGLGLDTFSVTPKSIASTKEYIRNV